MRTRKPNRTAEEQVAELQAKIEAIKTRDERKKARANPAVRQITIAVRALDKAAAATQDKVTRQAIEEARTTLAAAVATNGVVLAPSTGAAPARKGRARRSQPVAG